jgi:predicted nucleic acid-binding protein
VLIVIADTGPLNDLLLIDQGDLLPRLFETIYIPEAVRAELSAAGAPQGVRDWIARPPPWLLVASTPDIRESLEPLDAGEQAAIALAIQMKAELLLIDDRAGVRAALAHGLEAVGTLGVLDQAAAAGLIDLRSALSRLTATNFHIRPQIIEALLSKHGGGR